jgi:CheY-like chemotaxis protein
MRRALVVSQSVSMSDVAQRVFRGLGIGATHVSNPSLLPAVVEAIGFDVIVFDMDLGEDDLARCRRMQPKAFLILASNTLVDPSEFDAQYVMLKPLNVVVLQRAVINLDLAGLKVSNS